MASYSQFISAICLLILTNLAIGQNYYSVDEHQYQCPKHWVRHEESCYRFVRSPLKIREEAKHTCEAYQSNLVNINTVDEHGFLLFQLQQNDPQHRRWYTGAKLQGGYWTNDDGSQLSNMENAFLPEYNDGTFNHDALAYAFSNKLKRWGLEKLSSNEELLYICEAPITILHSLVEDERDYKYGIEINNPLKIPRGPYFIEQPKKTIFDVFKTKLTNEVSLTCIAGGYPTPTYEWFKEEYDNARLIATAIDPLKNKRYTVTGGSLIIYKPQEDIDHGTYHCKASNKFGTIISESVELLFDNTREFNFMRSEERGDQNWGKVVYCDPPQHYPGVKYYWTRESFPNFVEEDKRVFVSNDGALYFSALEPIDQGNYSCTVQSAASDTGRNGPFFPLRVNPHSSFQQLKFPNNFPKLFPEAPVAGEVVRLECIAFGYPVATYNWTRREGQLPRDSILTSYNRVLIIPRVKIEDQGEYICRAHNDGLSIEGTVFLSVQAVPYFTIPLVDKHMDDRADLTWTCEAFGIPDVTYNWFKNGQLLENYTLDPEDIDRYIIRDNVLKIQRVDPEKDPGMYQCSAKNQLKTKYSSGQLRVLSMKPSFKKHPMESEVYAAERNNVTIKCNPEAAPKPKFSWKKDGMIIGAGGRRRILDNGDLIISPVSRDDEGTYTCTASNEHGTDQTRGRLIVLYGPRFIETLPPRINTAVMNNQTLRCQADTEAVLDVAYIWKHNGMPIRDQDLLTNLRLKIDGGVFEIINITLMDAGDYECTIKSAVGEVSTQTTVFVDGPPGPPGGVEVINTVKTSVKLEWTDSTFNGRKIIKYTISARTLWSNQWFNVSEDIQAVEVNRYTGRKEVYLQNVLNPFTTYEFRVSAANELGYGPPSLPSPKSTTEPDKPTKAPEKLGGGGGKTGDLTITWEPLPPADQNGRGIHYKIYWRRKNDTEFQSHSLKDFGNIGIYVVDIDIKNFYTEYEVQIQAINEVGAGPLSNIVTIYSAEDMPQVQPQQVSALSYNSTSLNVSWAPIDQSRDRVHGKLIGHRLKYWPEVNKEDQAVYYLSRTTRPWALIVGLQPDTRYWVKVMAYNSAGAGPESERFLERTYRKAPQNPPSSVFVNDVNPSTIRVVWRYVQPSLDEEPLDGYKIRVWEIDQDMSTANDTIVPSGGNLEAYVYNLSPGKTYNLRVLAFSRGGDGRMSSPPNSFQMGDPIFFRNHASSVFQNSFFIFTLIFIYQLSHFLL